MTGKWDFRMWMAIICTIVIWSMFFYRCSTEPDFPKEWVGNKDLFSLQKQGELWNGMVMTLGSL